MGDIICFYSCCSTDSGIIFAFDYTHCEVIDKPPPFDYCLAEFLNRKLNYPESSSKKSRPMTDPDHPAVPIFRPVVMNRLFHPLTTLCCLLLPLLVSLIHQNNPERLRLQFTRMIPPQLVLHHLMPFPYLILLSGINWAPLIWQDRLRVDTQCCLLTHLL